ncbi:MAG: PorP/SprF family type IX secretion system membrane protein [Saprospiraceae bacterium]
MPRIPTLFLFLLFTGIFGGTLRAQDPVFSQFYAAPVQLNPALAGVSGAPRISGIYRNQYPSWPNAFVTYGLSYEQPLEGTNSSIGLALTTDNQAEGLYRVNYFKAVYVYEVRMGETVNARIGIQAGAVNSAVDQQRLIFGDQLDEINGFDPADGESMEMLSNLSQTSFDVGAGLVIYGGPLYAGLTLDHLNRPSENLLELGTSLYAGRPLRTTIHAGGQINLKRYTNRRRPGYVTPNILYTRQGGFQQLMVGAHFGWGPVFAGGYFRHAFENADAAVATVGFRKDIFRIGYSYDAVLSTRFASPAGLGGAHEISFSIDFGESASLKRRKSKSRFEDCFGMFR